MIIYKSKRTGLFFISKEENRSINVIGEIDDSFIIGFLIKKDPYNYPYSEPVCIDKSHLLNWMRTQLELF